MLSRNALIGSLVGLLSMGTLVASNFNGETTINDAKAFMTNATQQLNVFKSNESKLANTITTLKASKKDLLEQIAILEKSNSDKVTEIASLNSQVTELNNRIQELEDLLANGGSTNDELINENNRLNQELTKANNEISKANSLVQQLQTQLNTANQTLNANKPMTNDEINALISDTPSQPPTTDEGNNPPPTPPTPPTVTYDYTIDNSNDYYDFKDLSIMIMGSQWVFEGTAQYPVVVYFSDGTTKNVDPNSVEDLSKKIDKIQYKTSSGTIKLIKVNR